MTVNYNSSNHLLDIENHGDVKNEDLKVEQKIEENSQQQEDDVFLDSNEPCLFVCYYCDKFTPTAIE